MKKSIVSSVILYFCMMCMLSGMEKNIPVVWKDPGKTFRDLQTYAFGFSQNEDEYFFSFQIKSLEKMLQNDSALFSFYLDTDNNIKTGRFTGKKGWDVQFNIIPKRQTLSSIVWEKNKVKAAHSFGAKEFKILVKPDNNLIIIAVKKVVYLKNIKIGKRFVLFEEHSDGKKMAEKGLMDGVVINLK